MSLRVTYIYSLYFTEKRFIARAFLLNFSLARLLLGNRLWIDLLVIDRLGLVLDQHFLWKLVVAT